MAIDSASTPLKVTTPALEAVLSDRCVLAWPHLAVCGAFSLLFLYLSYMPLYHAHGWRHVAEGQRILATGQLPTTSSLPLADGVDYVAVSWLSQVVMAAVEQFAGKDGLSSLLAVGLLAAVLILARTLYITAHRKRLMLFGAGLLLLLWQPQWGVLQPQVLGVLCFATMLWLLVADAERSPSQFASALGGTAAPSLRLWIGLPLLMILWANLDGSFVIGLLVLLAVAGGRLVDAAMAEHGLRGALRLSSVRCWVWLAEFCLLATLVNPYGWELWGHLLRMENNPLFLAWGGWRPLSLASSAGLGFSLCLLISLGIARLSRLPLKAADLLPLLLVSVLAAGNHLLVWWFAPVFVLVSAPHLAEIASRWGWLRQADKSTDAESRDKPLRFAWTLVCCLLVWITFAITPVSNSLLGGKGRSERQLHDLETPLGAAQFLAKNPAGGLMMTPMEWGDFFQHEAPQTALYLSTDAFQLPRQVRSDYLRVNEGDPSWPDVLDRYAVEQLVVRKETQKRLYRSALQNADWRPLYEDEQAAVFARKPLAVPYVQATEGRVSQSAAGKKGGV
ncbi:hypothetical protein [Lignipirellula cremea]|uniref:Glycosyltransferase RgtA/B/C/D-like domain-containing protein n=1 Tax=Lignipirellula cremea TaxID=2528010 RepID=A0A518E551_9BACT|nr:hypothetical protein [Lignipirellula cremea]QDU99214.1 hypothetical protein Pla8534_71270 [Lignipirellula cremea]